MLIYSNPFYKGDVSHDGYEADERDALCSKCYKVLDRQIKYRLVDSDFRFSSQEKAEWDRCPFCGEPLYKMIEIIGFDNNDSLDDGVSKFIHLDIKMADNDTRKDLYNIKEPYVEVVFCTEGSATSNVILYSLDGEDIDSHNWEPVELFQFSKEELNQIYDYINKNNLKDKC